MKNIRNDTIGKFDGTTFIYLGRAYPTLKESGDFYSVGIEGIWFNLPYTHNVKVLTPYMHNLVALSVATRFLAKYQP